MAIEIKSSLVNDPDFELTKESLIQASMIDGKDKFRVKTLEYINDSSLDEDDQFFYKMLEFVRFLHPSDSAVAYTDPYKIIYMNCPKKNIGENVRFWDFIYDHECLHQLWDTFGVAEKIKAKGYEYNHEILNIASDCVINDYLYYIRRKARPDNLITPELLKEKFGVIYDRKNDTQYSLYLKLLNCEKRKELENLGKKEEEKWSGKIKPASIKDNDDDSDDGGSTSTKHSEEYIKGWRQGIQDVLDKKVDPTTYVPIPAMNDFQHGYNDVLEKIKDGVENGISRSKSDSNSNSNSDLPEIPWDDDNMPNENDSKGQNGNGNGSEGNKGSNGNDSKDIDKMDKDDAAKDAEKSAKEAKDAADSISNDSNSSSDDSGSDDSHSGSSKNDKSDSKSSSVKDKANELADKAAKAAQAAKKAADEGNTEEARKNAKEAAEAAAEAKKLADQEKSNSEVDKMSPEEAVEDAEKSASSAEKSAETAEKAAENISKKSSSDSDEAKNADELAKKAKEAAKKAKEAAKKAKEAASKGDEETVKNETKKARDYERIAKEAADDIGNEKDDVEFNQNSSQDKDKTPGKENAKDNTKYKVDLDKIKEKAEKIIEEYRRKVSGDFGTFIKKCRVSTELRTSGLAVKSDHGNTNAWNQQMTQYINGFIKRKIFQKKRELELTYKRPNRRQGEWKPGDVILKGKRVKRDGLSINVAFYIDRSGSMQNCINDVWKATYLLCEALGKQFKKEKVVDKVEFKMHAFDYSMHELKYGSKMSADGGTMNFDTILSYINNHTKDFLINVILTDAGFTVNENEIKKFMKELEQNMVLFITNSPESTIEKLSKNEFKQNLYYILADSKFTIDTKGIEKEIGMKY